MRRLHLILWLVAAVGMSNAQWLNRKTPGVPRLENGTPDMMAPAPRLADGRPDFSGLWFPKASNLGSDFTQRMRQEDVAPWARAMHRERLDRFMIDLPHTRCLPWGPLANLLTTDALRIVQGPDIIVILNADMTYRQIHMDGRQLEQDPEPSWMGYSVGHWDGDTLVVETNGYNDRTWLDPEGHPHSEKLRMTERFRRVSFGTIELDAVFSDPSIYAEPIHAKSKMVFAVDTGQLEYVCENEKDGAHFTGKASDQSQYPLSPEALVRYAGQYVLENAGPAVPPWRLEVVGDALRIGHPVFGPTLLRPIGPETFAGAGFTIYFQEENGRMKLMARFVEGDYYGVRADPMGAADH
jgi:hypothetical protein